MIIRELDLISHSRADKKRPHGLRGFTSSFVFHALFVAFVIEMSLLYRVQLPLDNSGSIAGAPVISLPTMTIIAAPARPAPPSPARHNAPVVANISTPSLPAMIPHPTPQALPPEPKIVPHPETGLPVLAGKLVHPVDAAKAIGGAPVHHAAEMAASGGGVGHLRPATANFVSSFAPGLELLPHPPYPPEARDLQETGTVRMLVRFDKAGNVARADVAQSSGVAILDSATRAFIRAHWHSTIFAGEEVALPVAYTLTSL